MDSFLLSNSLTKFQINLAAQCPVSQFSVSLIFRVRIVFPILRVMAISSQMGLMPGQMPTMVQYSKGQGIQVMGDRGILEKALDEY